MKDVGDWQNRYPNKVADAERAAATVRPRHRVFIGSGAGEPQTLVEALSAREGLSDTEVVLVMAKVNNSTITYPGG